MLYSQYIIKSEAHLRKVARRWNQLTAEERLAQAKKCYLGSGAPENPRFYVGIFDGVGILLPVDNPTAVIYKVGKATLVDYFWDESDGRVTEAISKVRAKASKS